MENQNINISCQTLPYLLSSFVDTFVDFSVSAGLFLPPPPPPPETSTKPPPPPPQTTTTTTKPPLSPLETTTTKPPSPENSTTTTKPSLRPPESSNKPLPASPENSTTTLQTIFPQPTRLIAIGDIHGDLYKAKQALRLAGLIDSGDHWCGGDTTLVQIGDILDRGGDEIKILYLFEKLKREAFVTGGRVICMNGNHETMNVAGDFRYVTREGLDEFKEYLFWYNVGSCMKKMCHGLVGCFVDPLEGLGSLRVPMVRSEEVLSGIRARYAVIRPDGPIASRFLAGNQTVVVVGDSIFVHGGLLPNHVEYGLERANEEISEWIRGVKGEVERELVRGRDSMVWSRKFSSELAKDCDCAMLEHVIKTIPGVKRMIMGHTIQEGGINGVCDNKAIRIDVGMSKGCGNGLPEVLEIMGNSEVRILTSNPLYQRGNESALIAEKKDGLGVFIPEMGPKQVEVKA